MRHDFARLLKRNRVWHGSAYPQRAFVEVRHEFAADKRNEAERRGKNQNRNQQRELAMVKAPVKLACINFLDPFKRAVLWLLHALGEHVRRQHWNQREREDQRADQANDMVSAMG